MSGNAGKGRPTGSRNKLTAETLALVADGKTPVAFALGIMNDDSRGMDLRLNAARIAAPYLHSKPQPEGRMISFALPANIATAEGLSQIHLNVLKSVAGGELSLDEGREISLLVENQRRIIETTDIVARLTKLEAAQSR
jgi:hypothetical protein